LGIEVVSDGIESLIVYLCGAAIVGVVTALIALWREFSAHKLHVAEMYMNKAAADEIKAEIKELRYVLWRVADKLEVPVTKEKW
jgi:hypothetical protein